MVHHTLKKGNIVGSIYLLQPGAGTMRPDIISSLITGGSVGGGGHTRLSISISVDRKMPGARSGGSVRADLIIIHSDNSSCSTDSRYIMSRSLTIAPLITMISSLLIIPSRIKKTFIQLFLSWEYVTTIYWLLKRIYLFDTQFRIIDMLNDCSFFASVAGIIKVYPVIHIPSM